MIRNIGSKLYKWWMQFARAIAFVNTRLLLTLFFVLVIGPIALVLKLIRKDFLQRSFDTSTSYWRVREPSEHTIENASRQF
ncbi:MAG TPA: SxtJ family membrane protein [Bacteroidota bacterium]